MWRTLIADSPPHKCNVPLPRRARQDPAGALARLAEALQALYPSLVPPSLVWGYGRALWDPATRVYGRKPLRVAVLGPAGSGKSTQCELLATRCGWQPASGAACGAACCRARLGVERCCLQCGVLPGRACPPPASAWGGVQGCQVANLVGGSPVASAAAGLACRASTSGICCTRRCSAARRWARRRRSTWTAAGPCQTGGRGAGGGQGVVARE